MQPPRAPPEEREVERVLARENTVLSKEGKVGGDMAGQDVVFKECQDAIVAPGSPHSGSRAQHGGPRGVPPPRPCMPSCTRGGG